MQITSEFSENAYAATQKYEGKTIAILGWATQIDIGPANKPIVLLGEGIDSEPLLGPTVWCYFDGRHQKLTDLRKGDLFIIIGKLWLYKSAFGIYLNHRRIE